MKINPKKILWPTDFSELALKASDYVRAYRDMFDAEVHIVHVSAPLPNPDTLPAGAELTVSDKGVLNTFLEAARTRLRRVADEHLGGVSPVVCEVLSGHPWCEVCEYAGRVGIDLIILTTHGLTGLRHLLIGSTAERVVQHAPCPVLAVKSVVRDLEHGWRHPYFPHGLPDDPPAFGIGPYDAASSAEHEVRALKGQAERIEGTLNEMRKRIAGLEAAQETKG